MMLDCQVKQIPEKLEKVIKEYEGLKANYTSLQTQMIKEYLVTSNRKQVSGIDVVLYI
jgi:hypothetical protein